MPLFIKINGLLINTMFINVDYKKNNIWPSTTNIYLEAFEYLRKMKKIKGEHLLNYNKQIET